MENKRVATLTLDDGRSIELPILSGTLGPDVIDIHNLSKLGLFTYDPAFFVTASCSSRIAFIDGDAGLLYYRGYPIEQLAKQSNFLEVSYLLLNGELPDAAQKTAFETRVKEHTMVHDQMNKFFTGFRQGADHRGDGTQIPHRFSVHVSEEQAQLRGKFHADDVRHPGGGLRAQPGA